MLEAIYTNVFARDIKKAQKRGKDMSKIKKVMTILINEKTLPRKHKEHRLIGNYASRMECHIEPDWLLIYKREEQSIIFERTGTHSDLF